MGRIFTFYYKISSAKSVSESESSDSESQPEDEEKTHVAADTPGKL